MEPTPTLPVMPLDYVDRVADPWRPVARLMAAAAVAQGVALVLPTLWELSQGTSVWGAFLYAGRDVVRWGMLLTDLLRSAAGITLAVGGGLACARRPAGRACVLWAEPAVAALGLAHTGLNIVRYYGLIRGATQWQMMMVDQLLSAVLPLVLPAVVWGFFRRPEVRAALADG